MVREDSPSEHRENLVLRPSQSVCLPCGNVTEGRKTTLPGYYLIQHVISKEHLHSNCIPRTKFLNSTQETPKSPLFQLSSTREYLVKAVDHQPDRKIGFLKHFSQTILNV